MSYRVSPVLAGAASATKEFLHAEPDISRDLAQKCWRYVTAGMKWNSGTSPIRVAILSVRSRLADFLEPEPPEQPRDFTWLEDGD